MSFSPPVVTFLISIVCGLFLGIIWDLNRVIKKNIIKNQKKEVKNKIIFLLDVCFCCVAAILTIVFFFIFTYGGFRAFVLAGELIGFVIYFCTITKFVYFILEAIFGSVLKFLIKFLRISKKLVCNVIDFLTKQITKIIKFFTELKNKIIKIKYHKFNKKN